MIMELARRDTDYHFAILVRIGKLSGESRVETPGEPSGSLIVACTTHVQALHLTRRAQRCRTVVLALFFIFIPTTAFAHGDPAVLYWAASALVLHVAVAVCFMSVEIFREIRWLTLAVYLVATTVAWVWALNAFGPRYVIYAVLFVVPIAVFVAAWKIALKKTE